MYLVKGKSGTYSPYDDGDYESSKKIKIGSIVKCNQARNYEFHKKVFALLNLGFSNQDRYTNFNLYRKVITIKAGYFDMVDGKAGKTFYIPKSISFEAMSQIEFQKFYDAVLLVISAEMETKPDDIQVELNSFF